MGTRQEGKDATALVRLSLKQSSHLVVARRSVAASKREQWGREGERDAERDGVSEEGRARGGDTQRERDRV